MTASDSPWPSRLAALAAATSTTDAAHDLQHLQRVWRTAEMLLADHPERARASRVCPTPPDGWVRRAPTAPIRWGAAATVPPR